MSQEIPAEVSAVGLDEWFSGLNDPNKVKVKRYLNGIDTSSVKSFFIDLMGRSYEDHNYKLSAAVGEYAKNLEMDDYSRFMVSESYIDGLFGAQMFDEAKKVCCENLDLYPKIKDQLLAANGGEIPQKMICRNRLIDIMVGVDSDYEGANDALDMFVDIGAMPEDELAYRKQSIRVYRLQTTFDNIFSIRPTE